MKYTVQILPRAQKELDQLSPSDFQRVNTAIFALADEPRPHGCKKLKGRQGWRIRVGRYRVLYDIHDDVRIVAIVEVGHRKEVYR